jgi:hypothetical protein
MFKHYTKKQSDDITPYNLYILYTENPKDRLQFHFKEKQFMDIKDKEINQESFFEKHKDIYNFFNKYFKIDRYIKDLILKWSSNTLEGAPKTVEGGFSCYDNQLTSLEGAPEVVGGYFDCSSNQLTSLVGAPEVVDGSFYCLSNQLTSLEGAPKTVGGGFYCYNNQLISLKGVPKTVEGHFNCSNNQLTSLEEAPKTVEGDFNCYDNQLTSLEGAPDVVDGDFHCTKNPNLSKEEIEKYHKTGAVKGSIYSDHGTYEPIN